MKSSSTIFLLIISIQVIICSENYELVTKEIHLDMNSLKEQAEDILEEVHTLNDVYKKSIPSQNNPVSSSFPTSRDRIYKWFSKRNGRSARKCLTSQKNLEMIRNHSSQNTHQCYSRIEHIMNVLCEKAAKLKIMTEKQVAVCLNLTLPCEIITNKGDCLTQAWEQAKQRRESIKAALQRFNILKKLREYEAELNSKLCKSVADSYQNAEKHEETVLDHCIKEEEKKEKEVPSPDHKL